MGNHISKYYTIQELYQYKVEDRSYLMSNKLRKEPHVTNLDIVEFHVYYGPYLNTK